MTDLNDLMRAAVADVMADDDLLGRVRARRMRRTRLRVGAAVTASAAALTGAVVVVGSGAGPGPAEPTRPRPVVTATAARPPLESVSHSRFDLTYLPPAMAPEYAAFQRDPEGRESERLNITARAGAGGPRPLIVLVTYESDDPVTLSDYRGVEPGARAMTVGSRAVIHVRNQPGGLNIYDWTETAGLNVTLDARDGVSDAEVRRLIAGLRLRPAAPTLRSFHEGAVDSPVTVPWTSAAFVAPDVVEITYFATDAPCRVLAGAQVTEGRDTVTVTLVEATPAGSNGSTCPQEGVTARTRVTLPAPMAGRRLLDGSATPPRERPTG